MAKFDDYPRIETKDIAKEVKSQLCAKFGISFSVTSDRNSLRVEWKDGPRQSLVAEIVDLFCGYESYFDSNYNDNYRSRVIDFQGQQATTHLKYLTYSRTFTAEFLNAALAIAKSRGVDTSTLSVVGWGYAGDYEKEVEAMQIARSLSDWELSLTHPSSQSLAKEVAKHEAIWLEFGFRPNDWTINYLEKQGFHHYQKRGKWRAFGRDKELDITVLDGHPTVTRKEEISVKFSDKPPEPIRKALKDQDFDWNKFEGRWFADYSSDRWYFAQKLESNADPATLPPPSRTTQDSQPSGIDKATKLREVADSMQKRINERLNPAIGKQRHTARRSRIASGIRQEGYVLEKQQELLYALADAHEGGYCPYLLEKIVNRRQVESLMGGATFPCWDNGGWWQPEFSVDHRSRLSKIGIYESNFKTAHDLLMNLANSAKDQERAKQEKLKELLSDVAHAKIPGYFPTPPKVVQRLLELADIKPGMSAWEPSAGSGAIADELAKITNFVYVSELNYSLRQILIHKGHRSESSNCFDCDRLFDRIVANPPWGKDAGESAAEHIQFYYSKLMPGGRLVSVCDEGVFFRSWTKDQEFRDWLDTVDATVEKIPDGAFLDSDRPTGVNCRIVTINKPVGVASTPIPVFSDSPVISASSSSPLIALQVLTLLDELDLDFVPEPEPVEPTFGEVLASICQSLELITQQSR